MYLLTYLLTYVLPVFLYMPPRHGRWQSCCR